MSNEAKIYPKAWMKLYIALIIASVILVVLAVLPIILALTLPDGVIDQAYPGALYGGGAAAIVLFAVFEFFSIKYNSHKDNKSPTASKLLKIWEILGLVLAVIGGALMIVGGVLDKTTSGEVSAIISIIGMGLVVINAIFSCIIYGIAVSKKRVAYKVK